MAFDEPQQAGSVNVGGFTYLFGEPVGCSALFIIREISSEEYYRRLGLEAAATGKVFRTQDRVPEWCQHFYLVTSD